MDPDARPVLRIIRGSPTDEELAALLGVLMVGARRPAPAATGSSPTSAWRTSGRPRSGWPVGPDAWRRALR